MQLLDNMTIARPYAQAAFEYALTQNDVQSWVVLLDKLSDYVADATVKEILNNPKYTEQQAQAVLLGLAGSSISTEQTNFIKLLAQKNRLPSLPAIKHLFHELKEASESMLNAKVFSVVPLDEAYQATLAQTLKQKYGSEVTLDCEIDEALVGGVVVRIEDKVIDKSISNQFERLRATLLSA